MFDPYFNSRDLLLSMHRQTSELTLFELVTLLCELTLSKWVSRILDLLTNFCHTLPKLVTWATTWKIL